MDGKQEHGTNIQITQWYFAPGYKWSMRMRYEYVKLIAQAWYWKFRNRWK